ncbi:hypothetical protein [Burkholderia sp. NFACC33-1]
MTRDGVEVWNCSARYAAAHFNVQSAWMDLPMSQRVQITPGVVFSADVLGAEWARKYQQFVGGEVLSGNAPSAVRRGRPQRRRCALAKRTLNRPFAGPLYLGVWPLVARGRRRAFGTPARTGGHRHRHRQQTAPGEYRCVRIGMRTV